MSPSTTSNGAAGQPSILENMTFGIELEMLALAPRNVNPSKYLSKAFRQPILLLCSRCKRDHPWQLPVEATPNSEGFVSPFSTWTVHRDPTVYADDDEDMFIPESSSCYSIELVFRVMNFCKHTPDPRGQAYPCTGEPFMWDPQIEIRAFIQRIHEAFSRPGYCVTNNRTTGFHIHFSNGENRPPVPTSLGMFAVFACLERHFDRISPASRICVMPFNGLTPGLINPYPVYKYRRGKQSDWIGPGSRVFLECIRSAVDSVTKDNPEPNRASVAAVLQECTPKAWFDIMLGCERAEDFLNAWPKTDSAGNGICPRTMAVNLQNLTSNLGKSTLEVRAAPGTVDFSEVWAWTESMGKLMLWLSSPDIDHETVIMDIWADPNSTILDLVKQVGTSQSTVDFYVDRLTPDWAVRRHDRLISNIDRTDPFMVFVYSNEYNRRLDYRVEAVESKISQKLYGGYYGQISDALFQTLPAALRTHPRNFLNANTCDYGRFADKVIAKAATVNTSLVLRGRSRFSINRGSHTNPSSTPAYTPKSSENLNPVHLSNLDDPFTNISGLPAPSAVPKYPGTLRGSNIPPYGRVAKH
ncbi:hypothetical protein E4T44_04813 [Aureobasidium sp. EXF-8845]|nr:hypothetical protein E4T44_04813 [Aureobasidium sp. EXF-8845]KAI4852520.1 hypothetical protein E4T45_04681 [Aureobasidium sp. EXF-8846]